MKVSASKIIGLVRRGEVPLDPAGRWVGPITSRRWLIWFGCLAIGGAVAAAFSTDPMMTSWERIASPTGILAINLFITGFLLFLIADLQIYSKARRDAELYLTSYYEALDILGIQPAEFMSFTPDQRREVVATSLQVLAREVSEAEEVYKREQTTKADRLHIRARTKLREAFEVFAFLNLIDREAGYAPFFTKT